MKIETKYNLGDHVIGLYTHNEEVRLYDDFIGWISIEERGVFYGFKESCTDFSQEDLVPYDDNVELAKLIKQRLETIRKEGKINEKP